MIEKLFLKPKNQIKVAMEYKSSRDNNLNL